MSPRPRSIWLREQARALRQWGHRPGEVARILGVHPSQVSRWTRGVKATVKSDKGPQRESSIPRGGKSQIQSHVLKQPEGRTFRGAHFWHWTARIGSTGRDLLLPQRRELKNTFVWWGPWGAAGFPVTLELHRGKRPGCGPGSLVVRFDVVAKQGETPYELRDRASQMVGEVLGSVARDRRMAFVSLRLSAKPHYEGEGEAFAGLAGREFRVTTQDAYGKVWIDWSRPGTREANMAESLAAYLRVDGNLQAALEEMRSVRADLRVVPEVVGALKDLAGEIRAVREPQAGPAAPSKPEGGYG